MRITTALYSVRRHLSDDLLKPKYRKRLNRKKTTGHCYVATEALWYLLNERQKQKYKPHYIKVNGDTHWFLMADQVGRVTEILDPTYDQFNQLPKYGKCIRAGFLTKTPSKRTLILLKRIENGRTKNYNS
jgi:hypothetical protein